MRTRHGIAWMSFLCASILLPGPAWPADDSCGSAPQQLDDWETASPEDVGFDAAVLCKIPQELAAQGQVAARPDRRNVHAVLVVRHGKLVFETYAAGEDENWNGPIGLVPHDAVTRHNVFSVTKSVVSLLFGIALERKLIAGTDIPVVPFFPEYAALKTPKWDKILLRNLLTMTPGYDWNEDDTPYVDPRNPVKAMYEAADPYRYILGREVVHEPDAEWHYNSGATELLGAVLKKATGKSLDEFAKEALFSPLHIEDVEWSTMPNGDPAAAGGLRLRPRDTAKIGQLVLNGGTWHGQRIVPEDWVKQSTKPRFDTSWYGMQYGYQWWLGTSPFGAGRTVDWIAAFGLGGQRIFIVPTLDLVVVTNAGLYDDHGQSDIVRSIFEYRVLAAIRDPV